MLKWSRYRPDVAQGVGRGIALLFHDRRTSRGWLVSSTLRPHFTPGKVPVPILQETGWAPSRVWKGGKSRPHRDSIPDLPARSPSLYQLSYPAHTHTHTHTHIYIFIYTSVISVWVILKRSLYNAAYFCSTLGKYTEFCPVEGAQNIFHFTILL